MSFNLIKYIGDSAKRVLSESDLQDIGATGEDLKSLGQGSVLTFVKGAAHELESGLAHFIANHPTLSHEFHLLSDDEAADEDPTTVTNPVSTPAVPTSSATSAESQSSSTTESPASSETETSGSSSSEVASTSPAETATIESAVATTPSPATSEVAAELPPNAGSAS